MTVIKQYQNKGRIYVQVSMPDGSLKSLPRANHNWLRYNPIFEDVPQGYVVHHLDHDPLNDDPSNLVIMYKHHHIAHHFKQKTPTGEVKLRKILFPGVPNKKPRCYQDKRNGSFLVAFYAKGIGGSPGKHYKMYRDEDGNTFTSREHAEAFIDRFWNKIQELNSLAS